MSDFGIAVCHRRNVDECQARGRSVYCNESLCIHKLLLKESDIADLLLYIYTILCERIYRGPYPSR
jgi:hypothetical protein